MQKAIAAFLDGPATCIGICGPVGCGKLYLVGQVASAKGLQYQIVDRSQGPINWNKIGGHTLAGNGFLTASLYIVCNAHETNWDFLPTLTGKAVFIANDESALSGLKKAKFALERMKRPTADQMCKTLFLEQDWPIEKATRLSQLAEGDWRKLANLEKLFQHTGVDVAAASEEEFNRALLDMAKDKVLDVHPTLAVHDLFSGAAGKKQQPLENYALASTVVWGEANLGLVCDSLENMMAMQEAAVTCDLLTSAEGDEGGFARELGLDHFVRNASAQAREDLRYDYRKYVNPFAKDAKLVKEIEESYDKARSSNWCLKRSSADDGGVEECGDGLSKKRPRAETKAKARAAAANKKASTKKVPKAK